MVKIINGTIFESSAQTLVNTINCVGVMGKGLALEFKNRYPAMFDKYKSFCDKGVFKPGVLWIYKAEDGKWILNFPTKVDWKNPSKIEYIEEGLKKFVEIWKEKGITSIAFPLLGCNNGGLDADEVIPIMEKYLSQCEGLDVTICDNRPPKIEEKPSVDVTTEFFGNEEPKTVVIEAKPLVDEEPPVPTDEVKEDSTTIVQENNEKESKDDEGEPQPSEEELLLKHLVREKQAMEKEIENALTEFVDKGNNAETRKEVTQKIVNVINRRGFPLGSVFQI